MDNVLVKMKFKTSRDFLKNWDYVCPTCCKDMTNEDFKDLLSVKEYTISGMCQACQDKVFNTTEEEY